jgi:ribosome-associated heat shock protein Hsp15
VNDTVQRIDKWLWCARFCKTRETAATLCEAGRVRIAGRTVVKAHTALHLGDVLTFPQGNRIRVVKVLAFAARRVGAPEARALYEDLALESPG